MHRSKTRGGLTISPVKFDIRDSPEKKLLKTLVMLMTAYEPSERPTIDEVMQELHVIAGRLNERKRVQIFKIIIICFLHIHTDNNYNHINNSKNKYV